MTRAEAQERADRFNAEHPDRATFRWFARQDGELWGVARVALPARRPIDPLKATIEARPRPPDAADPRPNVWRDAGGPWIAG